jgi:hypothetical protein
MQPERLEEVDDEDVGNKTITQPVEGAQRASSPDLEGVYHELAEKEVDPKRG